MTKEDNKHSCKKKHMIRATQQFTNAYTHMDGLVDMVGDMQKHLQVDRFPLVVQGTLLEPRTADLQEPSMDNDITMK